ncbi:MAG TPA: response regulator transcription factor, partial [bacterium]|nr:response regulator transcription factor [bacterium]
MLRILLCDDHPILREGLKKILLAQPDIKVVEEAGSGSELLDKSAGSRFDVIILDITLPDTNGLEVLKNLQAAGRTTGVLVLSMHPEEQYATRALKAGASG